MTEITLMIRRMEERDVTRAGEVIVTAFNDVFARHGFPQPFPSPEAGIGLARGYLHMEPQECFVAVEGGQVVGSGFLHLRGDTAGIGPITVDPACQTKGVGKEIMMTVIRAGRHCPSLRLVQDAFNIVSFPLYSKLGFAACGTVISLVGQDFRLPGRTRGIAIREMAADDAARVTALDTKLTGITRPQDVQYFLGQRPQLISLVEGKLAGYLCLLRTSGGTFLGPAAATEPAVLRALIAQAIEMEQGKILRMRLPGRHAELFRDLMKMGFQVETLQNYMVRGLWKPPRGVDLLALFPEAL
ncbi:MAG: GNAT family N-acetyltransferase [Deltaproteobacteria bacterium]|nr:GNAT family N-acetyltransferase [Deltaproteobacteria bacterium]